MTKTGNRTAFSPDSRRSCVLSCLEFSADVPSLFSLSISRINWGKSGKRGVDDDKKMLCFECHYLANASFISLLNLLTMMITEVTLTMSDSIDFVFLARCGSRRRLLWLHSIFFLYLVKLCLFLNFKSCLIFSLMTMEFLLYKITNDDDCNQNDDVVREICVSWLESCLGRRTSRQSVWIEVYSRQKHERKRWDKKFLR